MCVLHTTSDNRIGDSSLELSLQQAEPGMTVSADVCDRSGRVLVGSGVCLQEKHIKLLKAWGVRSIVVRKDGENLSLDEPEINDLSPWEKEAATLFNFADRQHPLVQKLIRHTAKKLYYLRGK